MAEFDTDPRFPSETQRMEERQAEIDQSLRQLKSRNSRVRSQAAKRLGDLRAEPVALLEILDDFNPYVRSAVAFALGYAAGPENQAEVVERLLAMIDDQNDYVCASAIHSLGVMQASAAREQILACLDDDNPVIVQAAILAAARIGPESLGEQLALFLDSSQYLILLAATRAMYLLDYLPAAPRLLANLQGLVQNRSQKDFKLPKAYIETLSKLQYAPAIPTLVEIAQHEVGLRSVAVGALIELKADEAAATLAPMLMEPSEGLRRHLIEMMVAANYRAALPIIRNLLQDPSAQIRDVALVAISTWKDSAAVEQVRWMAFHDPNPFVRPQAIASLAILLERAALADLAVLSRDSNMYVRQAALTAMERLDVFPEKAMPAIGQNGISLNLQFEPSFGTASDSKPIFMIPIEVDQVTLRKQLEAWQNGLPAFAGDHDLEQIAELDLALSTLITYLHHMD